MPVQHRILSFCRCAAFTLVAATCLPAGAMEFEEYRLGRVLIEKAGKGDLAAVRELLEAGADTSFVDQRGGTALTVAASQGKLEVVQALLAAGAKVNTRSAGWTALVHATVGGHVEVVEALLAAKADPDLTSSSLGGGRTPLMWAFSVGNTKMAQVLLEGGASVHARTSYGATPLRFAMWQDDGPAELALIEKLLAAGADVDAGHWPRFSLENASSNPTRGTRTAEGTALGDVADGSANKVRLLLAAGAEVDARQPGWMTPLMLAAASGNAPVVSLLLEAGADVNAKDSRDRTALDMARREDCPYATPPRLPDGFDCGAVVQLLQEAVVSPLPAQ